MGPENLYDLNRRELVSRLRGWGFRVQDAARVWDGLYRELVSSTAALADLRPDLFDWLHEETCLRLPELQVALTSSDGETRKFLLRLHDGQAIETVIMRFHGRRDRRQETRRFTACVSTQAGCAMGCVFCATGQMGFNRHLTAGEIVGQVVFVERLLRAEGAGLRNIVLMGMGEPLHNYDQTLKAVEIVCDPRGIALAPRRITLSTVGLPDGIRRLAEEPLPINLAVSLHGATDEERRRLVPPARRWPLAELMAACREYIERRQRRIFFEWTLIEGENDTPEQAHQLGRLLAGMDAHINVIPLNPTGGYDGRPSDDSRVKAFQQVLAGYGLPSTVRQRRGIDIAAGCGQLAATQTP